jgi:hypothetical protein
MRRRKVHRGLFHAAALNLCLRDIVVDGVEMRMANHRAPSDFFADVMDARVRGNLDLVGGFGFDAA